MYTEDKNQTFKNHTGWCSVQMITVELGPEYRVKWTLCLERGKYVSLAYIDNSGAI